MGFSQQESQLELFDVKGEAAPKPRAEYPGRLFFQARYDQLVLGAVGVVLGLTVIFAFGVERGKELVRSERMLLARQPAADAADAPAVRASAPQPGTETPATPAPAAPKPAAGAKPAVSPKPTATPTAVPKPKVRVVAAPVVKAGAEAKAGAKGSRYAVQVATFGQAQAARRELDRLQAKGKRAFMVMREGRTAVYVGPLPSKSVASEELTGLKSQYRDCFVKAL